MMIIEVYFDGLCQPYNPGGIACYAFVIKEFSGGRSHEKKHTIHSDYGLAAEPFTDDATNNVAEYTAIIKALEWLLQNPDTCNNTNNQIVIKGDSKLVINQLLGEYKIKAPRIIPLYQKATSLLSKFKEDIIQIEWVPREKNAEADKLSYKAYREVLENNPALLQKVSQYMATDKQLQLLKSLGITPEKHLSKSEASRLLSKMTKPI
jgi:ribonuclease HI